MNKPNGREWSMNNAIAAEKKWLEEVRKNVKRYECFPYAEVFHFRDNVHSIFVPCTHNKGDVWLHLVEGPEKALLIDTGFGVGDLKALCTELVGDKEIIVVNSHCHGDHSLGNSQFGKVYIHKYDAPMLIDQQREDFFDEFNHVGEDVWKHYYKDEDIIPFSKYEVIPCEDETIFNLGGDYDVVLYHVPGHTPGGAVFLDKKARILYSGDAIMYLTNGISGPVKDNYKNTEFSTVAAYKVGLEKLSQHLDEFDVVWPGHASLEVPKQIVCDMLICCNEIIDDPDSNEYEIHHNNRDVKMKVHGYGNIVYSDNRIGI